jgi:hypothetical protein
MTRSKPNKPLKSPNKPQNNEQNKQNKENTTQNVTPHTARATTTQTGTETAKESTEKRDRPFEKYVSNPENTPYYDRDKLYRRIDRKDQNKQQFDEDGEVIDSRDNEFKKPPDEYAQGNILTMSQLLINGMEKSNQTPNKQDAKPAAKEEEQETPPSP